MNKTDNVSWPVITATHRINKLKDGAQSLFLEGTPMFIYTGNLSYGEDRHITLLNLPKLNECLAKTATRMYNDSLGVIESGAPRTWEESLTDMIARPRESIFPLGILFTKNERSVFSSASLTNIVTAWGGNHPRVPNYWGITGSKTQILGFCLKDIPSSFSYAFDGSKFSTAPYVPRMIPFIENGNAGPKYCDDLDFIATPKEADRWCSELVYRAPESPVSGSPITIKEGYYMRFGIVIRNTYFGTFSKDRNGDPVSLTTRATLSSQSEMTLKNTNLLTMHVSKDQLFSWKR